MENPLPFDNVLFDGWIYDTQARCICHNGHISSDQANELDIYSFTPLDIFIVEVFLWPQQLEDNWDELVKKKFFIRSYGRAINFARKIAKLDIAKKVNIIGIRPVTEDEYKIFENCYAHLFYEGHLSDHNFLTDTEAEALPDPDYLVRIK